MRASWLRSRWVVVPGAILAITLAWNLHVAAHATGVIEGRVVDRSGRPVEGAIVTLFNRSFITNDPRQRTTTGPEGRFRFEGNDSHAVQLEAEVAGHRSERMTVRLWFRAQERRLETPLVLAGR
ncbi:carboxypeptidase-like regulatory domain-containing protein [Elioraea tepidiphila]|jgi:protocatechuate 3,4-dioxygenase beta subunit|uniref:carboxypeptidase-like regulatory domain-containing protein n=1 Tax=Elioraea tepidiphila TaxID=457934 RepID=UPI002FD8DB0B